MDSFDKMLKSKAQSEKMVTPKQFDERVENILTNLSKKKTKKNSMRIVAIVAAITILTTVTVVAAPSIIMFTGDIINYFNGSDDPKYISDKDLFEKYNGKVGASVSDKGITLTIDNIAIDNNFINVFYTIKSKSIIPKIGEDGGPSHWSAYFDAPLLQHKIDGKYVQPSNTYDTDAYYESKNTLKGMQRVNISQNEISKDFELETYAQEIFGIKGEWHIFLNIDTSIVKAKTTIVNPKIKATISGGKDNHDITIEKVILSPFGNQIVISEKSKGPVFNSFALQDDKGNFLDICPSYINFGGPNDIATNSFEFINKRTDMKYLMLTPIYLGTNSSSPKIISSDISKDNIQLKQSEVGTVHIENIEITDTDAIIEYRIEGVVPVLGGFLLLDENEERIRLDTYIDEKVNRQTGLHTIKHTFENPTAEEISKLKKIGIFTVPVRMNYDEQVKIPLN